MGAEDRDEEVNDEETAPSEELLLGGKMIKPDGMVESKKDAAKSHGTTRGKPLADLPRSSGPRWPLREAGSIEGRDRLPPRTRWSTGARPSGRRLCTMQEQPEELELISVVPAGRTCIRSVTPMLQQGTDQSQDLSARRSSVVRT